MEGFFLMAGKRAMRTQNFRQEKPFHHLSPLAGGARVPTPHRSPRYPCVRTLRTVRTTWAWSRIVSAGSAPGCRPNPQYIATPKSEM
jgi:hypothetical protein